MIPGYEYITKMFYKDVEIIFVSSNVIGGKKTATKEFINSDLQLVEELGKKQRSYSVEAIVALIKDEADYKAKRDAIIEALESPGPGVLVHPVHGIIENVLAQSWSLNETTTEIGVGLLQIDFVISNVNYGPVQDVVTASLLSQNNKVVLGNSQSLIENKFTSNPQLLGVYSAATDKLTKLGAKFNSSIKFAVKKVDDVSDAISKPTDVLANTIGEFNGLIVKLASAPRQLAASITNVFETINGTIATASAAYEVYKNFFQFGWTDDIELRFNTVANRTKNNNNRLMNDTINSIALSNAYLFASQKDYKTVDEIDADIIILEAQLAALLDRPNIDQELIANVLNVRQTANELLSIARLNASVVIEVEVGITSARALSYLYYGDDSRANEIARLNSGPGLFLEDTVKILSK